MWYYCCFMKKGEQKNIDYKDVTINPLLEKNNLSSHD